jgi:hypothetical protein
VGGVHKRRAGNQATVMTVAAGEGAKRPRVDDGGMCTPSFTDAARTAPSEESPATGLLPSFLRYTGIDDAAG